MQVYNHVSLQDMSTFQVPVFAKKIIVFSSFEDVVQNYKANLELFKDSFVLGGGSNTLFVGNQDQNFIILDFRGQKIIKQSKNYVFVEVLAGTIWDNFVKWVVNNKFYGIENLSFIPGTVGGAVVQNIGAYGVEIANFIVDVTVLNKQTGEINILSKHDCYFSYRNSIFKQNLDKFIVLKTTLRLETKPNFNLEHKDLQIFLNDNTATSTKIRRHLYKVRNSKLPDWHKEPNAGSVFVNPVIDKNKLQELQQKLPDIPYYEIKEANRPSKKSATSYKIPAAWLIDKAGLKGFKLGGAKVSEKHALVFVNKGDKTGKDIYALIKHVQDTILEEFGIRLKPEIRILVNGRLFN